MTIKRIVFGLFIFSTLACNFVTQMVVPPTPAASQTPVATVTQVPTATPVPLQPAYIPPECAAAPLATVSPLQALQSTPEIEIEDVPQDEQLRILDQLADVVEQIYVYPDYNGRNWTQIETRYRSKVEAGLDTPAFYEEMSAMIGQLGDEHSFFLSPHEVEEAEAELRGEVEYVGVGLYGQWVPERRRLVIVSLFPGSPADYAGIEHHDSILEVDGLPLNQEFADLLRGPQCSAVVLKVQSPGEAPRDVMLVRDAIHGNIPIEARRVVTTDGSRIGYIFIPSFFDETLPGQIENALNDFGPLDGLILDLRMNGGGSSSVVYPILEYFIQGTLGRFVSRASDRPLEIAANEVQNSQTVPLVVMVSQDTVSFGEIFAGVLQDAGRAEIVGETTLGNVEVLHGYSFEDGSQVWLAAETFSSAFSDVNWEETGIVPDLEAFAEWDSFYFETDPSISAAVNLLGNQ